jgi:hypothetical protein
LYIKNSTGKIGIYSERYKTKIRWTSQLIRYFVRRNYGTDL